MSTRQQAAIRFGLLADIKMWGKKGAVLRAKHFLSHCENKKYATGYESCCKEIFGGAW